MTRAIIFSYRTLWQISKSNIDVIIIDNYLFFIISMWKNVGKKIVSFQITVKNGVTSHNFSTLSYSIADCIHYGRRYICTSIIFVLTIVWKFFEQFGVRSCDRYSPELFWPNFSPSWKSCWQNLHNNVKCVCLA